MDLQYIHDNLMVKTIDHCMNNPNQFTSLPKQTTIFLKKQCTLWRGNVTIFKIQITILTPADPTTKSKEVSKYT